MSEQLFSDDKLSVAVKADASDEIKRAYCTFGWKLEDEYDDGNYRDIIHMEFSRPHFIKGKDRLQLLQVRYPSTGLVGSLSYVIDILEGFLGKPDYSIENLDHYGKCNPRLVVHFRKRFLRR